MHARVDRREVLLTCGGILLLLLSVYVRVLGSDFVYWDDPQLIVQNMFSHGLSWTNIVFAFTHYDPDLYVPMTFLSFQANYALGALSPFIYHFTNLLLHAGSTMLVAWIIYQISGKKNVALITALLFALHPINTEAVAWASARKDVLSAFFFLLSAGTFLHAEGKSRKWSFVSIVAYLFGLLSKASILPLPLILLLIEWYRAGAIKPAAIQRSIPYFVLSAVFGVVAIFGKTGGVVPFWQIFLVGMKATMFSLLHLVIPYGYSVIYEQSMPIVSDPLVYVSLIAVIAITAGLLWKRKRLPTVLFAWIWFVLLIIPSFFTAEKGKDILPDVYLTSDRYVYLSAISIFFLIALALPQLKRFHQKLPQIASVGILTACAILSFIQSATWEDTQSLLTHALRFTPDSAIAHTNLGAYYDSYGEDERAYQEFSAAVKGGGSSDAWYNLAVSLIRQQRTTEALEALLHAVERRPSHAMAQLNLGALLFNAGRLQEAIDHLVTAQQLDPNNLTVYLNLGIALEKAGDLSASAQAFSLALQLDPSNSFAQGKLTELEKKMK